MQTLLTNKVKMKHKQTSRYNWQQGNSVSEGGKAKSNKTV
jgi:hypothetical protein